MSRKKITLPLVDGGQYRNGQGRVVTIGGPCVDHPEWVWGLHGEWYRRSDGRVIVYRLVDPKGHMSGPYHHIPEEITTSRDLKENA